MLGWRLLSEELFKWHKIGPLHICNYFIWRTAHINNTLSKPITVNSLSATRMQQFMLAALVSSGESWRREGQSWERRAEVKKMSSCHCWLLFEYCLYLLSFIPQKLLITVPPGGAVLNIQPKSHKGWELPKAFLPFLPDTEHQTSSLGHSSLPVPVREHGGHKMKVGEAMWGMRGHGSCPFCLF